MGVMIAPPGHGVPWAGQGGTPTHPPTLETDEMSGTIDADVISEALEIIDRGLGQLLHRELVSTTEATDLLLDVRSLLAGAVTELEPVGN
jgi:hypothetical protein